MKKRHFFTLSILGVFILYVSLIIQPREARANFRNKVAGTYLLNQSDGFHQILTITASGEALSQNSGQMIPPPFGDQQGTWKRIDDRQVIIKTLDFIFAPDTGVFTGFGRSSFTVEFQPGFNEINGEVLVEIFGPDQNPLDPDATPINTFGPNTFTGQRITAD
jgi:hypothetical protein